MPRSVTKALLLTSPGRSKFRITECGLDALKRQPVQIDNKFLERYPEFLVFRDGRTNGRAEPSQVIIEETNQTPQEILDASYQSLRKTLAQKILERIKNSPPKFFENLVLDLLLAMGYGKTLGKLLVK